MGLALGWKLEIEHDVVDYLCDVIVDQPYAVLFLCFRHKVIQNKCKFKYYAYEILNYSKD